MVDDETDAWLDTLAGRRGGGADARADSEAHLLRSAILARSSEAVDEVAARDPAREEALVSRARAAGLLPQADAAVRLRSPAAAGPLRRMPRAARWLAAAAVAGLAIGLTLQLSPHRPTPVLRGGASVTRIGATDPPALQQQ